MNDYQARVREEVATGHPPPAGDPSSGEEERRPAGIEGSSVLRALLLLVAFFTISVIVAVRLVTWQTPASSARGRAPVAQAAENVRGRILDRNGLLLMASEQAAELVSGVAGILGWSEEAVQAALSGEASLIVLAKGLSEDQCWAIGQLGRPTLLWCDRRRTRVYPQGALAAHIVGFANYQQQGVAGAEWYYDGWLRSQRDEWPAQRIPQTDPEPLPDAWRLYLPSPGGQDLVLYLNGALQYMVERRLAEALRYYGAESGIIIVMDPRSGAILAQANLPSFDPNRYTDADEELWGNPAVRNSYEPGSVFKLVTIGAALDTGKVTPDSVYRDAGSLTVSGRTIRNAEQRVYGAVTVREALAKSINVVTAQICLDMGPDLFYRYVRQFGFGRLTEVDLNYESEGIVKTPGNPQWSQYDQAANAYGQGIAVTALQMTNAVAAIANGGMLLQPQVARSLVRDGRVYPIPTRVLGQVLKPETARTLTQMMVYNVESSSNPSPVPGFRVAGKTGTAEIPTEQGYTSQEVITSFAGFLPAADPQIVVLVKLVKPTRSRWAEHVAVPVFAQVAGDAVQVLGIRPDDRMP